MKRLLLVKKRVISLVTNDLEGDQRVHKTALSLMMQAWEVKLVGRQLSDSCPLQRSYKTRRLKLLFRTGPGFYAEINLRFFVLLLFVRTDLILANDLDTLLAAWLVAKIRHLPLIFDSHEYFTEVPELINRPRTQHIWKAIERFLLPRVKHMITVNEEIADLFRQEYNVNAEVIMNLPVQKEQSRVRPLTPSGGDKKTQIIYQGAVNIGRGLEQLIKAMEYLPDHYLTIVGGGDLLEELEDVAASYSWKDRIHFTGRVPFEEVAGYTREADFGVSLEQDFGLNYRLALPNKLFDYIGASLPVLVSDLPVMSKFVKKLDVGLVVSNYDPVSLASSIRGITSDRERYMAWCENASKVSPDYTWNKQEARLLGVFENAIKHGI